MPIHDPPKLQLERQSFRTEPGNAFHPHGRRQCDSRSRVRHRAAARVTRLLRHGCRRIERHEVPVSCRLATLVSFTSSYGLGWPYLCSNPCHSVRQAAVEVQTGDRLVDFPYRCTAALTCTPCRYFKGQVPSEPFLETYLKRPNPMSFFCSHQGFML